MVSLRIRSFIGSDASTPNRVLLYSLMHMSVGRQLLPDRPLPAQQLAASIEQLLLPSPALGKGVGFAHTHMHCIKKRANLGSWTPTMRAW